MINHDEMLDNVASYALGVLPANESAMVQEHLHACRECREEYAFVSPAVTLVACTAQAEPSAVSPLLKNRLVRQVGRTRRQRPWVAWAGLAAAACLIVAVLVGVGHLVLQRRLDRDRALLSQQRRGIPVLTAPGAKHYRFPNGEVIARGEQLYIGMRGLRTLPSDKVYQAWTLAAGSKTMAPSVTFRAGHGGDALVSLPVSAPTIVAVAVSVEPAGGSQQPTTKPIAIVKLR
jgi:anti-sigma-K factor RskA